MIERLQMIRREQGDNALPLASKKNPISSKWKAIAQKGILHRGFAPTYPAVLSISTEVFCDTFPYHIVFDEKLTIIHSGVRIQKMMPTIRLGGAHVGDFLELVYPSYVDITFANILKFIDTPFAFMTISDKMNMDWGEKPMLILKGRCCIRKQTKVPIGKRHNLLN